MFIAGFGTLKKPKQTKRYQLPEVFPNFMFATLHIPKELKPNIYYSLKRIPNIRKILETHLST